MKKTKRATIKDVAKLAGVSRATVSLILGSRDKELRVVQEVRECVLSIARQQHYRSSIHARSSRDNRDHTVGLVAPEIVNYESTIFSRELETLCREADVQLLISCADKDPSQETMVVNNMIVRQINGLIIASSTLHDDDYQKLSEQLPAVLFDRHMDGSTLPLVTTDSVSPTVALVADITRSHLDEFCLLGGQPRLLPTRDRLEGFTQGLQQAGVTP